MRKYIDLMLRNLSRCVLAALLALFGVVYFLKGQEQAFYLPIPEPPPEVLPEPVLDTPESERATELLTERPPIDQTRIRRIVEFDIFDMKIHRDMAVFEENAKARFAAAEQAFDAAQYDKAQSICEEILDGILPTHLKSKDMLLKIKKLEAAMAAKTPEPTVAVALEE